MLQIFHMPKLLDVHLREKLLELKKDLQSTDLSQCLELPLSNKYLWQKHANIHATFIAPINGVNRIPYTDDDTEADDTTARLHILNWQLGQCSQKCKQQLHCHVNLLY